ncbi:MAG: hypothetical protein QOE45_2850 [Frankiaceae bacterium]|nr:hypothetical protein [Frankiaceae bacterium]
MTDVEEPALARGAVVVGMVALALLAFAGVLLLRPPWRSPDAPAPTVATVADGGLSAALVKPEGYDPIPDADSGGGAQTEAAAQRLLGGVALPGYRGGVLRAWAWRGTELRAVVVLGLAFDAPANAGSAAAAHLAAVRAGGATSFAVGIPGAAGYRDVRDPQGRYAQRVVFTRGARLYVVGTVTPQRSADASAVLAHTARQYAAG